MGKLEVSVRWWENYFWNMSVKLSPAVRPTGGVSLSLFPAVTPTGKGSLSPSPATTTTAGFSSSLSSAVRATGVFSSSLSSYDGGGGVGGTTFGAITKLGLAWDSHGIIVHHCIHLTDVVLFENADDCHIVLMLWLGISVPGHQIANNIDGVNIPMQRYGLMSICCLTSLKRGSIVRLASATVGQIFLRLER